VTYSIVARDPETGEFGVGAQSHFFSVGSIATFAEAGVGAICSQAFASRQYGPLGLDLLRAGQPAPAALPALTSLDPNRDIRQVVMVDAAGRAAAFTGARCAPQTGHRVDDAVAAAGNMLASDETWGAMIDAYHKADGDLAERLLSALEAAEEAGGDARGRQSAHLLVVSGERTGRPWEGVLFDLRVDDHPEPLTELRRLLTLRRGYGIVGSVLFEGGPLFEPADALDPDRLEAALAGLATASEIIGAIGANPEPTLWRAVLLARAGRVPEAAELLRPLVAATPSLAGFVAGLPAAGFLPAEVIPQLLPPGGEEFR
jgi:uncharacterized Ntn-hydrolase superfamily protein